MAITEEIHIIKKLGETQAQSQGT